MEIQIYTSFNPGNVEGLKYSALMVNEYGNTGEYYCEADTYAEAVEEAKRAAREYEQSAAGAGERIKEIHMSEACQNGNAVSRDKISL